MKDLHRPHPAAQAAEPELEPLPPQPEVEDERGLMATLVWANLSEIEAELDRPVPPPRFDA